MSQWIMSLTRNWWVLVRREFEPIKGSRSFVDQDTIHALLSTGWLQERNRA